MLPSLVLYGTLNNYFLKFCCKNDITDKENTIKKFLGLKDFIT